MTSSFYKLIFTSIFALIFSNSAQPEIIIGVGGPMTGKHAIKGLAITEGVRAAINMINFNGGIHQESLSLIVANDQCDSIGARSAANDLINRGAFAVIGHPCKESALSASVIYEDMEVPLFLPDSSDYEITLQGASNVFRTGSINSEYGIVAGKWLKKINATRPALIFQSSLSRKHIVDNTLEYLESIQIHPALYDRIDDSNKNSGILNRIQAMSVDSIVFVGDSVVLEPYLKSLEYSNNQVPILIISKKNFTKNPSTELFENIVFIQKKEISKSNLIKLKKWLNPGINITASTVRSFAAVEIWAKAAKLAGLKSIDRLSGVIRIGNYKTIAGEIRFTSSGNRIPIDLELFKLQNGKKTLVNFD